MLKVNNNGNKTSASLTFTWSKLIIETLQNGVKYVQS